MGLRLKKEMLSVRVCVCFKISITRNYVKDTIIIQQTKESAVRECVSLQV